MPRLEMTSEIFDALWRNPGEGIPGDGVVTAIIDARPPPGAQVEGNGLTDCLFRRIAELEEENARLKIEMERAKAQEFRPK